MEKEIHINLTTECNEGEKKTITVNAEECGCGDMVKVVGDEIRIKLPKEEEKKEEEKNIKVIVKKMKKEEEKAETVDVTVAAECEDGDKICETVESCCEEGKKTIKIVLDKKKSDGKVKTINLTLPEMQKDGIKIKCGEGSCKVTTKETCCDDGTKVIEIDASGDACC